jgi:hypothetical protein
LHKPVLKGHGFSRITEADVVAVLKEHGFSRAAKDRINRGL